MTSPLNAEWCPSRSKQTDGVLAELKRARPARWPDLLEPSRGFHLVAAIAVMLLVALHLGRANQSVNLAWDANPEPDLAKYKVYWGLESGAPTESLDVGKVTAATVRHLDDGATYFFTVTAINEAGEESGPSNEVSHTTPSPPAKAPYAHRRERNRQRPLPSGQVGPCACQSTKSRRTI